MNLFAPETDDETIIDDMSVHHMIDQGVAVEHVHFDVVEECINEVQQQMR